MISRLSPPAVNYTVGALKDWGTLVALLLREGGAVSLGDGSKAQFQPDSNASVLLRIFVASAVKTQTRADALTLINQDVARGDISGTARKRSRGARGADDAESLQEETVTLGAVLCSELPALLIRFRDSEESVVELARLLTCDSLTESLGQLKPAAAKGFLKEIGDLFRGSRSEVLMTRIAEALRLYQRIGGATGEHTKTLLRSLASSAFSNVIGAYGQVKDLDLLSALQRTAEIDLESSQSLSQGSSQCRQGKKKGKEDSESKKFAGVSKSNEMVTGGTYSQPTMTLSFHFSYHSPYCSRSWTSPCLSCGQAYRSLRVCGKLLIAGPCSSVGTSPFIR